MYKKIAVSFIFLAVWIMAVMEPRGIYASQNMNDVSSVIAQGQCGNNISCVLYENGLLEITGKGNMWATYDEGFPWEEYKDKIVKIRMSDEITGIGERAFEGCKNLTGELQLPKDLIYIGDHAFSGCSGLTGNLTFPDHVETIGEYAFYECDGFSGDLIFSDHVETIGEYAFFGCDGFSGNLILSNGLQELGKEAFDYCRGFTGKLILPEGLTDIKERTFDNCNNFTGDLILPEGVKYIEKRAFYGYGNQTRGEIALYLPKSLVSVGESAISNTTYKDLHYSGSSDTWKTITFGNNNIMSYEHSIFCSDGIAGKSGELDWVITEEGTLIIEGTGNYEEKHFTAPIYGKYSDLIIHAIVKVNGITNMEAMFAKCEKLQDVKFVDCDTSEVTSMEAMFEECKNLNNIEFGDFDTSKVTDMCSMFFDCESLEELDVSFFDTSNVTNMHLMFGYCKRLNELNLNNFDTSKVTIMSGMFAECESLKKLDVSSFNTSNVVITHGSEGFHSGMFEGCSSLTALDISNFDTSNMNSVSHMFRRCSSLTSLDLGNFDFSNIKDVEEVLSECSALSYVVFPKNLPLAIRLPSWYRPEEKQFVWKDSSGTVCTEARANISHSMTYTKFYIENSTDNTEKPGGNISIDGDSTNTEQITVNDINASNNQISLGNTQNSHKIKISKIKICAPSAKLAAGKKVKLKAVIAPSNAAEKSVQWVSGYPKYASVSSDGTVTLKKAGIGKKVLIVAAAEDGSNTKAVYAITIKKHAVKSIKLSSDTNIVKAGKSKKIKARIKTTGSDANKSLAWSCSNTKYATVSKNGVVKTKRAGKGKNVIITAKATDGSSKKAKFKIKIR